MAKKKQEIKLNVTFTDGWEDRLAKAAYELYERLEAKNQQAELTECQKATA